MSDGPLYVGTTMQTKSVPVKSGAVSQPQADQIRELAAKPGPWISIYLGIHRPGEPAHDRIRLKNMADRLNHELEERNVPVAERRELLAPVRAQADSLDDQTPDAKTLVLFRSAAEYRILSFNCEAKE